MPVGTSLNQVLAPIREVTSLAPTGAGSLHEALTADAMGAGAIIDFDVAGNINRIGMADLVIDQPGFQIRGASAPGEGINVVGCGVRVKRSGTVLSGFRIIPGDKPGGTSYVNRDCIGIEGEAFPVEDILIEDMLLAYAMDGLMDVWTTRGKRITIRRNMFVEPLNASLHPSGEHATCLLIAGGATDILIEGNLFAHWKYRAPAVGGPTNIAVVNNLYYNVRDMLWKLDGPGEQPGGTIKIAFMGNHSMMGPASPWYRTAPHFEVVETDLSVFPDSRVFYSDNITTAHADLVNGNAGMGIVAHPQYASMNSWPTTTPRIAALGFPLMTGTNPVDVAGITPLASSAVKAYVLANSGPKTAAGALRNSILETRIRAEVADGRIGSLKNTVPAAEAAYFGFPSEPVPTYGDIDDAPILASIKSLAESMYPDNAVTDTTLTPGVTRTAILGVLDTLDVGVGQPLITVDAVRSAALSIAAEAEALIESIDRQRVNNTKPHWQG